MRPVIHGGDIYQNNVELDFSVNINPLGIPKKVKEEMHKAIDSCEHYPDISHTKLIAKIAENYHIPAEHILCGNGASELFVAIVHAVRPRKIIIPVPSFFGYERAAGVTDAVVTYYEMKESDNFCLTENFLQELQEDVDLLFLANPNNPVGNTIEESLLEQICDRCKEKQITVVLDECFLEFTEKKGFFSKHNLYDYPNVIVVKAFTKLYAIPGVRLGFLFCGGKEQTDRISLQLPEWNISVIAEAAGLAALEEKEYCDETVSYIRTEREYLEKELENADIQVFPGEADFLLLKTKQPLYDRLLEQKILIRDCSNYKGLQTGYYRVAVKQHEDNEKLIAAIKKGRQDSQDSE